MEIVILLIKLFVVFNVIMGLASLCTWFERKASALMQDRIGANRAGAFFDTPKIALPNPLLNVLVAPANLALKPVFWLIRWLGILGVINTLVCDAVKALTKEDFIPQGMSPFVHALAPFIAVFPIFVAFALVPLAPDFTVGGMTIRPQLASVDAGVLFILAMGSIAVYGVAFAGWCGNNKFALLGALRAAAQMISYELSLGTAFVAVILTYGTLDLYEMVTAQQGLIGGVLPAWGVFTQPLTFVILFIVGMAETKRGPFDLPESESELVAGYFTEYSGMKFLVFWLGEFAEIALFALLISLLFFGGWDIPFVKLPEGTWWAALLGHIALMTKVVFFCVLQIVIRWTLPRFRYDQLMNLGWKGLLPLSIANLMVYGALKVAGVI
jgi:NADH-quinone oxidoreductase subunit H